MLESLVYLNNLYNIRRLAAPPSSTPPLLLHILPRHLPRLHSLYFCVSAVPLVLSTTLVLPRPALPPCRRNTVYFIIQRRASGRAQKTACRHEARRDFPAPPYPFLLAHGEERPWKQGLSNLRNAATLPGP
ncbi:hypothetical protein E2C01_018367 [Portunus trituberculatus]|uniref:Uncharacterized protein n=1 Tax=Portunus trituberculatus TaxID=210409 RepID=A0A5B7DUB2_PORTR|nr:hypothetical protein [Portunus trituberculatus]